ncbi:MAG: methyltransferase domain-containing protein [Nanoarchaeota archaeon]|nr:methyltransferase domain-containing protein [Nanoarchaeota archaeon]
MELFKNIKDTEKEIAKAEALLKQGIQKDRICAALKISEEACEIAAARLRNEKTGKTSHKGLFMSLNDLRFATNEEVAKYRAKRLKCNTIIEIGSGIGLQSFEFAKTCKRVIAIEIDKRKYEYAKKNAEMLGINNIEFINADALKLKKIPNADIVFCETEREAEEKERKIEKLKPDIRKVLETYGKITKDICIEVPPRIKEAAYECEKEYLSVSHGLNRLDLYFGKLRKCAISAVIAETGERLEGETKQMEESRPLKYIHEPDKAAEKAGLLWAIPGKGLYAYKDFLTSKNPIKSSFIKSSFEVLHRCIGFDEAIKALKKENCGKAILRYSISPDRYWKERKKYEDELKGGEILYLFSSGKELLVCKKI